MFNSKALLTFCITICVVFMILGYNLNYLYYFLGAISGVFAILIYNNYKKTKYKLYIEKEIVNWYKKKKRKYSFEVYSSLEEILPEEKGTFRIDDQTWSDLNLDNIFKKIDTTYTIAGQQVLYKILRNISINRNKLSDRNKAINEILKNDPLRKNIIKSLVPIGIKDADKATDFLFQTISFNGKFLKFLKFLRLLAPLSLLLCFINIKLGVILFIGCLVFNVGNYYKTKDFVGSYVDAMRYMSSVMSASNSLLKSDIALIDIDKERLSTAIKKTLPIRKKFDKLIFGNNKVGLASELSIIYDYLNILFLIEPILFFDSIQYVDKYREDMKFIYEVVGEIDALLSIAAYRKNNPNYCEPVFSETNNFNIKDAYYVLVENPINNSIAVEPNHGVLITGSNMSGKSTFLRTISSSIVLAQSIATVPASSYECDILKPFTSISISDNVDIGDSYYLAEVKAIKRILDYSKEDVSIICFIDEIFSGTNRIERTAASIEILDYLKNKNITAFVATHDLEITKEISGYDKYYFKEKVSEDDIIFDYTLNIGISNTSNAIEILKLVGYPDEIYLAAKEKADRMREE